MYLPFNMHRIGYVLVREATGTLFIRRNNDG
jgi:hypothetical protein